MEREKENTDPISLYVISGPCGCGKTSVSRLLAEMLSSVYRIEGDTLHAGFCGRNDVPWEKRLAVTWEQICLLAQNTLSNGFHTVVDYVVEGELPQLLKATAGYTVDIYYVVLTASEKTLQKRLSRRGDAELLERSWFLRKKLIGDTQNRSFLLETDSKTPGELAASIFQNPYFLL